MAEQAVLEVDEVSAIYLHDHYFIHQGKEHRRRGIIVCVRLDAINRVLDQEYQLAFLLKPITPAVVKAVADVGGRMPRKSTYFYPKAPAGLVFHRLV